MQCVPYKRRKEIGMEIIKHGFGGSRKRQNFACHECGCVFIAEPTEYRTRRCYSTLELFDVHSCACPECGEMVTETEVVRDD